MIKHVERADLIDDIQPTLSASEKKIHGKAEELHCVIETALVAMDTMEVLRCADNFRLH